MTRDWLRWHQEYDSPNSSLARRLQVVQSYLRQALTEAPHGLDGRRHLISICAGDGRDVLPVLAEHDGGARVTALLIELDPVLSERARARSAALGLSGVEVRTADAGTTDTYRHVPPAQLAMACGVFGNITLADVRRTIAALRSLLVPGGIVIWTRGRTDGAHDPSLDVRACFTDHGFSEMSFTCPADAAFRVGMHRLNAPPVTASLPEPGTRMFTFV